MHDTSYPARALAAYYRALARHHRAHFPIDDLPSQAFAEIIEDRAYVIVHNGSRLLAVYRIKPDGPLRRLKRWPKVLDRRLS
jgi:hypothetical protein